MIELHGKQVLTETWEIAAPAHTALLVVDMQNDCCASGGAFALQGADTSMYEQSVPRIARVLDAARQAGVRVIFVKFTTLPGGAGQSPAQLLFEHRMKESYPRADDRAFDFCRPGTWGHEVLDGLRPGPEELVVEKHRSSAFVGTNLDLILRSNGIKTIVVTGCTTEGCVDSTIRDGGFLDYYPVVVSDCVASDDPALHDAAMTILRAYRALVIDSDELLAAWTPAAEPAEASTAGGSAR